MQANSDFQSVVGYDEQPPKDWILCVGAKQIAERFDCLAFTLEMPFKDTVEDPRPRTGWNPDRCMKLGGSMLDAVKVMVPLLRPEFAHLGEKSPHKVEDKEEQTVASPRCPPSSAWCRSLGILSTIVDPIVNCVMWSFFVLGE